MQSSRKISQNRILSEIVIMCMCYAKSTHGLSLAKHSLLLCDRSIYYIIYGHYYIKATLYEYN